MLSWDFREEERQQTIWGRVLSPDGPIESSVLDQEGVYSNTNKCLELDYPTEIFATIENFHFVQSHGTSHLWLLHT